MDSTWRVVEEHQSREERAKATAVLEELYAKERRQREELQEEARTRGMFIDVLAHELRTPLTPILLSSNFASGRTGFCSGGNP